MSNGSATVVLLSGGIDSAVVVSLVVADRTGVSAVWIDYGQPAGFSERTASNRVAAHYRIPWREVVVKGLLPPAAGEFPGRNDLLVAVAGAAAPGAAIAIGVHSGTGYADCSPDWTDRWQDLITAQKPGAFGLFAPLVHLTKGQVYALARDQQVPFGLTHSCEAANDPCGCCTSCADRRTLVVSS